MSGEQRHINPIPDDNTSFRTLSLTDAYIAKVNAALGAGDDSLVSELADAYLDEAIAGVAC